MTFAIRRLQVQLQLNGTTFDSSGNDTLTIEGLRMTCTVTAYSGAGGSFQSNVQISIRGMLASDMSKLSTLGFASSVYKQNAINVYAGDDNAGMSLIFSGGIMSCNIDYNQMPDVSVEIVAFATANGQFSKIAASSFKGSVSAASMLQAICASATPPINFVNNGVTAKLENHAVAGTAEDQIREICKAVNCYRVLTPGNPQTLTIWPQGATIDDTVLDVNAENGMVGYPMYNVRGLDVVCEFNPNIRTGTQVKLSTSIAPPPAIPGSAAALRASSFGGVPGASGTYKVYSVVHDLSSEVPGGPWFTHIGLSGQNFNGQ
jgi:hypothetical protein